MYKQGKKNIKKKIPKRGLSVIIGFVLLIVFGVVMGVIIYKWQKSFVPQDPYASCPEGASIFIINKTYDCQSNTLTFFIRNNGRFSLGGYFIYVKDSESKTIATIDLSRNNTDFPDPRLHEFGINGIKLGIEGEELPFFVSNNYFLPREEEKETYDLTGIDKIYSIEIVPIRWQTEGRKDVLASCKDAKLVETVYECSSECEPENIALTCSGRECGMATNNCYKEVNCGSECSPEKFCSSEGRCITIEGCTSNCENLGYQCGTQTVCGRSVNCGVCPDIPNGFSQCNGLGRCSISGCNYGWGDCDGIYSTGCETYLATDKLNCGSCGASCSVTNHEYCESGVCFEGSSCDGIWDYGHETQDVECDGLAPAHCQGCDCDTFFKEAEDLSGNCELDPDAIKSCPDTCYLLGYMGYSYCTSSEGTCKSDHIGVYVPSGDVFCAEFRSPQADSCCCYPN